VITCRIVARHKRRAARLVNVPERVEAKRLAPLRAAVIAEFPPFAKKREGLGNLSPRVGQTPPGVALFGVGCR
jgi:hypothetical protein